MKIFRGLHHRDLGGGCALTIGNFDGVHRGHQAMLRQLAQAAAARGVKSCVMTFEPHPRDYFAAVRQQPDLAPARISTLRDKLAALASCGMDQTVILPFNARLASQPPERFISDVLVRGLQVQYVLVGDDFRFGARRAGDYAMLREAGQRHGFAVADLPSYEVGGERVSSSAVRQALAAGRMDEAAALLGRPWTISGHVIHGRRLGRELAASSTGSGDGFRTLNLLLSNRRHAWKPAASGIFVVRVHGLSDQPLPGVANLGVRPSLDSNDVNAGRILLETHCLYWPSSLGPEGGYGKIIRVELLHKLHDELRYHSLAALTEGIARDIAEARRWLGLPAAQRI
ncbi:MAG: bifunctional riboflavin kinase/FAD synthetase [Ottowia sp.]|nr:bifunctional riboflavin kinase/FAD synthetase [Ottowia sp.]